MSYAVRIQGGRVAEPPMVIPSEHSFKELFHKELYYGEGLDPNAGFIEISGDDAPLEGMLYQNGVFLKPPAPVVPPIDPKLKTKRDYLQKIMATSGVTLPTHGGDSSDVVIALLEILLLCDDDTKTKLAHHAKVHRDAAS